VTSLAAALLLCVDPPALEREVHEAVNAYRVSIGRSALVLDEQVSAVARGRSREIAEGRSKFGHTGFTDRVEAVAQTLILRAMSENLYRGTGADGFATRAMRSWLTSGGHKKNLEGDHNITGVGVAESPEGEVIITQIYVRSPGRRR